MCANDDITNNTVPFDVRDVYQLVVIGVRILLESYYYFLFFADIVRTISQMEESDSGTVTVVKGHRIRVG